MSAPQCPSLAEKEEQRDLKALLALKESDIREMEKEITRLEEELAKAKS